MPWTKKAEKQIGQTDSGATYEILHDESKGYWVKELGKVYFPTLEAVMKYAETELE